MSRTFLALIAATVIGAAAPASALSISVDFPVLTYPPVQTPDVSQGCSDLTTLNGAACTTLSK